MKDGQPAKRKHRPILAYIAVWQFMAFIILLCVVWINEILDLPALLFDAEPSGIDVTRASTLSAAVLVCAIVAVGNTYTQQKHILRGLLILCSSCRKIRVNRGMWEELNLYLERNTLAEFHLDMCPGCFGDMEREITEANVRRWKADTRKQEGEKR